MLVEEAKALARRWVLEEGQHLAGFCGAYVAGSVNWLPGDAELPATSDLDVHVVLEEPGSLKPGKFIYHGVLREAASTCTAGPSMLECMRESRQSQLSGGCHRWQRRDRTAGSSRPIARW